MAERPAGDAERKKDEAALVPLLLLLTLVTGAVDAVSILRLGHVFVANMTGNVVFLGFALAGAKGFSITASFVALASFLAGAAVGGRLPASSRRQRLARVALGEAVLAGASAIVAASGGGTAARYAITVLLAVAMGGQNAMARKLAVPDLTTTVLTLTLTGLASDRPDLAKPGFHTVRRLSAVAAILAGAVAGAVLVLHTSTGWALGATAILLAAVAVAAAWPSGHRGRG